HLFRGDYPVYCPAETPTMDRDEDRIVPGLLDPGKGILHAGDIREDLYPLFREIPEQETGNAEEVRIARAEYDRPPCGVFQGFEHYRKIFQQQLLPGEIWEIVKMALMTDQHLGLADNLKRLAAEPFPAGDAGADEIDFLLRHINLRKSLKQWNADQI